MRKYCRKKNGFWEDEICGLLLALTNFRVAT
jgi:hypothetical protein